MHRSDQTQARAPSENRGARRRASKKCGPRIARPSVSSWSSATRTGPRNSRSTSLLGCGIYWKSAARRGLGIWLRRAMEKRSAEFRRFAQALDRSVRVRGGRIVVGTNQPKWSCRNSADSKAPKQAFAMPDIFGRLNRVARPAWTQRKYSSRVQFDEIARSPVCQVCM